MGKRYDYLETDDCQAGCKFFTGGEVRHHPDCIYYPESFSKMYDDLKTKMELFCTKRLVYACLSRTKEYAGGI